MFGLGVPELALILIIGLVVFGPSKLPEIGKALGKSIKEFKSNAAEDETPAQQQQMTNVTEQPKELPPKTNETTKQ